jgi:hypothetical protein
LIEVVSDLIEQAKSQNPWKVLVVDDYALKILSTATKLFDLADERISGSFIIIIAIGYFLFSL